MSALFKAICISNWPPFKSLSLFNPCLFLSPPHSPPSSFLSDPVLCVPSTMSISRMRSVCFAHVQAQDGSQRARGTEEAERRGLGWSVSLFAPLPSLLPQESPVHGVRAVEYEPAWGTEEVRQGCGTPCEGGEVLQSAAVPGAQTTQEGECATCRYQAGQYSGELVWGKTRVLWSTKI